jgi:hypothetical protein
MTDSPGRFILCRPLAGLNDVLCQVAKCHEYAMRFGRCVVVDTTYPHPSGSGALADRISNYFSSRRPDLRFDLDSVPELPILGPCIPECLTGRINGYRLRYDSDQRRHLDVEMRQPVTFDFDKDYDAPLLVHSSNGGGDKSIDVLAHMCVTPQITAILSDRLSRLTERYCALHIRATDLRADFEPALPRILDLLPDEVFVATDNIDVLDYVKKLLGSQRVISFSTLPTKGGRPIHKPGKGGSRFLINADAIVDLLMLALADNVFAFEINKRISPGYSGFSRLAANLHRSGNVLQELLNIDGELRTQLERLGITPGFPATPKPLPLPGVLAS